VTPTEEQFRVVEGLLDTLVAADAARLVAHGIEMTDLSERQRNYKSPFLCWSYRFESRKCLQPPEIASVAVSLSCPEPVAAADAFEVALWSRAEVFQRGALSRWDRVTECVLTVEEVKMSGIADVVSKYVDDGFRALESATR
jgi:hypothetical protein